MTERSLEELLWLAISRRARGLVVLRDRDGLRHGVWVHAGFVVGIHVAGSFDPLLDRLRRDGQLSPGGYRACVEALYRTRCRAGTLAVEVAGIARVVVRDALRAQAQSRMGALLRLAAERGHDARLEPGEVPPCEMGVRMPLGALLRGAGAELLPSSGHEPGPSRAEARRRLRQTAFRLHPDRHGHLSPEARAQLQRDLALATAAYHRTAG